MLLRIGKDDALVAEESGEWARYPPIHKVSARASDEDWENGGREGVRE
jgi:hypothetical protein